MLTQTLAQHLDVQGELGAVGSALLQLNTPRHVGGI